MLTFIFALAALGYAVAATNVKVRVNGRELICHTDGVDPIGEDELTCRCAKGFSGAFCQEETASTDCPFNYCQEYKNKTGVEPCRNGGSCINRPVQHMFICACPCGWYGRYCEINPDDCGRDNPCVNGGTCVDGINSFTCSCPNGYYGQYCQSMMNYCPVSHCENGATCIPIPGWYKCECAPGWEGPRCSQDIDECREGSQYCYYPGTAECKNSPGSYSCTCDDGFWSRDCNYDINNYKNALTPTGMTLCDEKDRDSNVCESHGVCFSDKKSNGVVEWTCFCGLGYTGPRCEVPPAS